MKQKKTPPLPPEIFKGMKTGKELNKFLSSIYKQGVEALLNAEMEEHLGYEKNGTKPDDTDNIRNGTSRKILKSDNGDMEINIPRDRERSFEPIIEPKYNRRCNNRNVFQRNDNQRHRTADKTNLRSGTKRNICIKYHSQNSG
jgi:putative transposase